MEEWMKKSWFFQQDMYKQNGDKCWNILTKKEEVTSIINYAFTVCYGPQYENVETFKKLFDDVKKKVFSYYGERKEMFFNFTLLNLWLKDNDNKVIYCVFWLKKDVYDSGVCIDRDCRTYENWQSFIKDNALPKCTMMYPRGGKYAIERGEVRDYIDVVFEESNACSNFKLVKRCCDVGSAITASTGVAVLMFNPVTAPVVIGAFAASVVGGAVSTACAADKLHDIHRHEGLNMTEAKTLFAVADVVLSAAGTVLVGVTAGCKVATTTGKFVSEGGLVIKLAKSTTNVCRVVSGVNAAFVLVEMIHKYQTGSLNVFDCKTLASMFLVVFNVYVNIPLIQTLLRHLGTVSLGSIALLMRNRSKIVAFGKRVLEMKNLNDLLEIILPVELPLLKNIFNHKKLIKPIFNAFADLSEKKCKNPISLIYDIICVLPDIFKLVDEYYKQSQQEMSQHFDRRTYDTIERWTSSDGLDLNNSEVSSYICKINSPIDIKNKVAETLKSLSRGPDETVLLQKRDELYSSLLEMVSQHPLKSYAYVINKVNYYCEIFKEFFSKVLDCHHFEYFLFTARKGFVCSRSDFFTKEMSVRGSLLDTVFSESLNFLRENLHDLHCTYEREAPEFDTIPDKVIYKFQVSKDTELSQDFYYGTVTKYMPDVMSENKDMVFEKHFDYLAILMCADFKILFYTYESDSSLDGLLIYLKNIDSDESV